MFDMGPYYLTALIFLIGPVRRVAGSTKITFSERTITSEPKYGEKIDVEIPTHVSGILDFENGAIGNIVTSFDVWKSDLPPIEIYGTKGTLGAPDPNTFDGPIKLYTKSSNEWKKVPLTHGHTGQERGIGLADMAYSLRTGWNQRTKGVVGYHVLEVMEKIQQASETGEYVKLESECRKPEPLPRDFPQNIEH